MTRLITSQNWVNGESISVKAVPQEEGYSEARSEALLTRSGENQVPEAPTSISCRAAVDLETRFHNMGESGSETESEPSASSPKPSQLTRRFKDLWNRLW